MCLLALYFSHYAQEVSTPNLSDVFIRIALFNEASCDVDEVVVALATFHAATAVEVRTDTDVIDTCHFNHVVEVCHEVVERCSFRIFVQEEVNDANLYHTIALSYGTQLFVGEVAVVVKQCS